MSGPLSDGDRTLSPAASDDSQPPPLTDLQRFARTLEVPPEKWTGGYAARAAALSDCS